MNRTTMRAVAVVASVYGHFLIFAQFSFVELLRLQGFGVAAEKSLLGAMALAGVIGGFGTAWRGVSPGRVRGAMVVAAMAAALAPLVSGLPLMGLVAVAAGAALGVATVGVSALLPGWCRLAWVGLATGLGYGICNLPVVFLASPATQAWVGAALAVVAAVAVPATHGPRDTDRGKAFPVWAAVLMFTALVWMDSAAFFIIQHHAELKQGTWGDGLLWRNALVHLAGGVVAGVWLARRAARPLVGVACGLLALAALMVNREATLPVAGWLYPAAVSLYSVGLIVWPGWFSGGIDTRRAAWRAAWMFAVAGWFGSANGIAMAEQLQRVSEALVMVACGVMLVVMTVSERRLWRVWLVSGVVLTATIYGWWMQPEMRHTDAIERGRQVYIAEGCIHCHSQYVRPGSPDESIWGPVKPLAEVIGDQPVAIGNRRQGPDLMNVGARRSPKWLELHFKDPRWLADGSWMPSYAYLFDDSRGDDLIQYLRQSGLQSMAAVSERAAAWAPVPGGDEDGRALFQRHCVACHGTDGRGGGTLAGEFAKAPANLVDGPFTWTVGDEGLELRVARVVKFGIIGTDMPGHEVLTDAEVNALVAELLRMRGR